MSCLVAKREPKGAKREQTGAKSEPNGDQNQHKINIKGRVAKRMRKGCEKEGPREDFLGAILVQNP